MNNRLLISAILITAMLIAGALVYTQKSQGTERGEQTQSPTTAVSIVDGIQYIDIKAKGGYFPQNINASANMKTVLRVSTNNTYDCSLALVVPDLGYRKVLAQTGIEEIEVPIEKTQGVLRGMCSMAMYHFQIEFK
jgi:plastocyanin domain-containing protein